jgi:N-methylhydantoinase B
MRYIIERTCQNYLIGQLHDVSVGIFDAEGNVVAMPVGLPVQYFGSFFAVQEIGRRYRGNLRPGDVILTNDPYGGGQCLHLPDWGFFRPVFAGEELVFWVLARAHQQDTGGAYPGGYFPNTYDVHAEGIRIPPLKVIEGGEERKELLELIWNNVRWPQGTRIDNYAMIAATAHAERRIGRLVERYGREVVLGCVREMMDRTERAMRAAIQRIPDGSYYGESATDDDGTVLDEPVWVRCWVHVRGDELLIDFSESDRQRRGFVNAIYATTYAAAMQGVILTVAPGELAEYHNQGSFRPVRVEAPLGSVVNAEYPAPVGASPVNVGTNVTEAVLMALSKALPERSVAGWGRRRGDYLFGVDPRTGERYVRTSFDYDGTGGAVYGFDGWPCLTSLGTLGSVTRGTVEEQEVRIPWRHLVWEYATDLEGAGRWRGGPGMHWEAVNEGGDAMMATGSSDGDETFAPGCLGGESTPPSRTYIRRGSELIRVKAHRLVELKAGDVLVKLSAGGAGVGNPGERDPEKVAEDVRNGLVSLERAKKVYKVVVDPETYQVSWEETRNLRTIVYV